MAALDIILLVEDNDDDAILIRRAFERATVENVLRRLDSAEQAMGYLTGIGQYADREKFPLPVFLLLDLQMPGMNGFEFLHWLRSQPGLRRIPVVVLTSASDLQSINAAYDAGANSYLKKPGAPEQVVRVIQQIRQYWASLNERPSLVLRNEAKQT